MYEFSEEIGFCPCCGAAVTAYYDGDAEMTLDCACAVGGDYIRINHAEVLILTPDRRDIDEDAVWAARLRDAERNERRFATETIKKAA